MCDCLSSSNVVVKIKLVDEKATMPKKASKEAGCYDVVAVDFHYNDVFDFWEYDLGFITEIPKGYVGHIVPRSSFTKIPFVMQNSPAQIDSDYRNTWKVRFRRTNSDYNDIPPYEIGDRIAQIYFEKELKVEFIESKELSGTDRNTGGFGSTGI